MLYGVSLLLSDFINGYSGDLKSVFTLLGSIDKCEDIQTAMITRPDITSLYMTDIYQSIKQYTIDNNIVYLKNLYSIITRLDRFITTNSIKLLSNDITDIIYHNQERILIGFNKIYIRNRYDYSYGVLLIPRRICMTDTIEIYSPNNNHFETYEFKKYKVYHTTGNGDSHTLILKRADISNMSYLEILHTDFLYFITVIAPMILDCGDTHRFNDLLIQIPYAFYQYNHRKLSPEFKLLCNTSMGNTREYIAGIKLICDNIECSKT